jgi:hypothetical protein
MKNHNKIQTAKEATIIKNISLEDCEIIAQWIHEENEQNGHHMLETTAQELFHQANTHGCCGIKELHKLIGFIKLMPVQKDGLTLFER